MTYKTDDIWYGQQCEARIGQMANETTDPTVWHALEYVKLTVTPQKDSVERNLIGRTTHNKLDPTETRDGLSRISASLILDADSRGLAQLLACALGDPVTTGPTTGIYTHTWMSGSDAKSYFAIQVKTGANEWRIYRGLTLSAISLEGRGDQAANYDITVALKGLSRDTIAAAIGDAPAAIYTQSYAKRVKFLVDGAAAEHVLSASWSWDRAVTEDAFCGDTMTPSQLRPDTGSKHTGQAQFRSMVTDFDTAEEGKVPIAAKVQFTGFASGHDMTFEHPVAYLDPCELPITGPGAIERTWSWNGKQDATHPATVITIKNDVVSY